MLASFGVFSVLSCKPSESCVMCLAQQSVFFFLCSACQLHITFDFPRLQADCRHHLVLSASFSFPFVTQRRQQILPSPWDSSLVSHIFSSVTCSLKGLLVSLGGSSVYFWLSHSSTQSCCQFTAGAGGGFLHKADPEWDTPERHPSTSSWYLFSNAPAWHLAPSPAIPAWDTFVSAYPLFSAILWLQTPTLSLYEFLHFYFKMSTFEKKPFRWIFSARSKKHVNINKANLITVWKEHLGTVCGCTYPAVSCTDRGKSYVFTDGEKYLAASSAFSRLLGILAKSVLYSFPIFCGP